jgi:hypothetical protein
MSIEQLEAISLSNHDISKLLNNTQNIFSYPQLKNFNSIEELLGPKGFAVILYLLQPTYGHWTCVFFIDNHTIEVFDSYGIGIDAELEFIKNPKVKSKLGMNNPYLTKLLWKARNKYDLTINHHKFQARRNNIATCGRHVIVRLWNQHMSLAEYKKLMYSTEFTPDELVTFLTQQYLE